MRHSTSLIYNLLHYDILFVTTVYMLIFWFHGEYLNLDLSTMCFLYLYIDGIVQAH